MIEVWSKSVLHTERGATQGETTIAGTRMPYRPKTAGSSSGARGGGTWS